MGFAARAASGRIDDPNAGSKVAGSGRVLDVHALASGRRQRLKIKIVKFQVRPDPLAK
jgi:hypothetical protein